MVGPSLCLPDATLSHHVRFSCREAPHGQQAFELAHVSNYPVSSGRKRPNDSHSRNARPADAPGQSAEFIAWHLSQTLAAERACGVAGVRFAFFAVSRGPEHKDETRRRDARPADAPGPSAESIAWHISQNPAAERASAMTAVRCAFLSIC